MRPTLTVRVVLVGDSAVGKTSMLNRFIDGRFDPDERGTIGTGYFKMSQIISGQAVTIDIWDTAGQEKYRSLGPLYYRDAAGAVVVCDATNAKSCEHLTEWISAFTQVAGHQTVIAIAANKIDLPNLVQEPLAQAECMALNSNYIFQQTSASTNQGIKLLFDQYFEAVVGAVTARKREMQTSAGSTETSSSCFC
jgi:small GTP-binding protein